jgi:hypothetical protein
MSLTIVSVSAGVDLGMALKMMRDGGDVDIKLH